MGEPGTCPHCGSIDIDVVDQKYVDDQMSVELICSTCDHIWEENYVLK